MSGSEMAKVIAIFLGVFIVLIGSARLPAICKIGEESRRKTLHIGAGILAMGLPALFERPTPVINLCGAVLAALMAMRFSKKRIYDADRISYGELCIPVAVAFLFVASARDAVNYYVPLAILTFADSAAAIVGQRLPSKRISAATGEKTIAGSAAFFAVAFLVTLGSLTLFVGNVSGKSLVMALIVAFDLTVVEAVCRYGFDNLLVPIVGFLLLHTLRPADAAEVTAYLILAGMVAVFFALQMSVRPAINRVKKTRAL